MCLIGFGSLQGLVGRNKNETKELNVLDGISGVLKPVSHVWDIHTIRKRLVE